jgi:hypothetical protein
MRAGREGAKIVKNRRLLPTDRFNAVKILKIYRGAADVSGSSTIRGGRSVRGFARSSDATALRRAVAKPAMFG